MYAARTGYRQQQDAEISALRADNARLRVELTRLRALLKEKGIEGTSINHPEGVRYE